MLILKEEEEFKNDEGEQRRFKEALVFATELGFVISAPIILGIILGKSLDSYLGTQPRFTLSLLFLGIAVSLVSLYRKIQSIE